MGVENIEKHNLKILLLQYIQTPFPTFPLLGGRGILVGFKLKHLVILTSLFPCFSAYSDQARHAHNGVLTPYIGEPPQIELQEKERKKLENEKPVYKKLDIQGTKRGIATFRVNAPVKTIWSVIRDFSSYPQWIEDIQKTEVYKQEGNDIFVRFEAENRFAGKSVWYAQHNYPMDDRDWGTWKLDYNYLSDLDDSVGFWRVTAVPGDPDRSDVVYSADLRLKQKIPSFVVSLIVKARLKQATQWVKEQAELRSGSRWDQLKSKIRETFPYAQYIGIEEFEKDWQDKALLVDVREKEEFDLSHIPNAIHSQDVKEIVRSAGQRPVVVYCSVGYRSARITTRLLKLGVDARNLEGSIFAWANSGRAVVDKQNERVSVVHHFDEEWGVYLDKKYHAQLSK